MASEWTIDGAAGEPIIGNTHLPRGDPAGVILIAHGFKGYKDYGMFPRIAETMAARGLVAHRFNFSHSGMTNETSTFERPDLFEQDTWNKQVHDQRAVMAAVTAGELEGQGLPVVFFGHSRGGVTVLLTAGRSAGDTTVPQPAGVVSASAPASCSSLTPEQAKELLDRGYLVSPSARTGQDLRLGRVFLAEQHADPDAHDLLKVVGRIDCPVILIHGQNDPTVPAACANTLAEALPGTPRVEIVPSANHVFNTPNPMPPDVQPTPQLQQLLTTLGDFALECCRNPSALRA